MIAKCKTYLANYIRTTRIASLSLVFLNQARVGEAVTTAVPAVVVMAVEAEATMRLRAEEDVNFTFLT